jgi:two-component system response regulator RstA
MTETHLISALVVEDDERLARFTAQFLEQNQVTVTIVTDGEAALAEVNRRRHDVMLLDLMLPVVDGMTVCKKVRETSDIPILLVTARVDEADRVEGLEHGADDYITKPFSPRELLARMRAVVRRDRGELAPKSREFEIGELRVNVARRSAILRGEHLPLSTAEFDLLAALAQQAGRVLSRDQLLRIARGTDSDTFDRAVDVQVSRLRQKLGPNGASLIRTVRGMGYMLVR